jgi:PAS domain S-box-containing protein
VEASLADDASAAGAIPAAGMNRIIAGAVRDFPPYYLSAPGSKPTGFAIDVLAETARRAGVTVEYRAFDSWKDAQTALRKGEIDLIPNMGVTPGRQDWIAFTPPYQSINVVLFVRAEKPPVYTLNDLRGRTIGVVTTNVGRQLVKKIPKVRERVFLNVDAALRALLDGKIDALIYPADVVRYRAKRMGVSGSIRVTGPTLAQVERAMAARTDRAAMLMGLEPHLRAYTGTKAYLDLYRRWFSPSSDAAGASPVWRYVAVFAVLVIVLAAIAWRVRRSRMANGPASKHVASLEARLGNRLLVRFGLISLISVIGFLAVIVYMYHVSFEATRASLAEAAETEASLINAVLRFDRDLSAKNALPKGTSALSEVIEALSRSYNNKMETLIAEHRGDYMLFLMRNRAPQDQMPDVVPLGSELAQPMQRALSGEMGTMIGRDYRGETVLAAYRPVEALNGGLVTKMDVAEIRAPFLMAGTIVMIAGLGFALLGGYLSIRTTLPIVQHAATNEEHIRDIFEELPIAIWEEDWSAVREIAVDRASGTASEGEHARAAEDDTNLLARLIEARTIVDISRGALSIHGSDDKQEEIARQARLDRMRPGEVQCFRDLLTAFAAGQDFAQSDFALPDPATGGPKHIRTRAVMPRNRRGDWSRVLRVETDRTAEHVAVAKISEREERFRQIAENLREVFWVSNADKSAIEYVSPAYETIWGRSAEEIYRNPGAFLEAIHPDDRPGVIESLGRQFDGTYDIEYRVVRPDGEVRWVRDRAAPIADDAGNVYRIVGVADDITDLKKKDRDLQQAQKIEALGQLVGGIAHDFNNVLTIILGNLELLESRLRNPANLKLLARVIEAARREGRMVDELLLFSRNHELKQEPCDVNDLLYRMKELLQRTLGGGIEIHTRFHPESCVVNVDVSYLQTAIINLAINARDAMPRGGDLIIETDVVDLDAAFLTRNPDAAPGRFVMIAVTDTGTGIPAANLPHVFEPFFTTKDAGKGTGMGLAMVYGFVKQSGGHISVYSEDRRGTSFKIYLPAAAAKAESAPQAGAPAPAALTGGNELVLLVEDEDLVRETAATLLTTLGYRVVEAASGPEAFEALKAHPDVDILFSDTVMPGGLTGLELARRVQKLNPRIKVLLTSGYLGDHSARMRKYARLRKPYSAADLASALRRVLDADDGAGDGDRRHERHSLRYH